MGWGEDTKLEAVEVWARVLRPRERRTREPRAAGLWLRSVSCGDPGGCWRRGGAEAGKGFLEPWGTSGPLRAIVRREDGLKQNELCVARGESGSEGVRRLNGDQPHPPLPRSAQTGKDPGGGWRPTPLSPRAPTPPSTSNLRSDEGTWELGEGPGTLALGAPALGRAWPRAGARMCREGCVCAA